PIAAAAADTSEPSEEPISETDLAGFDLDALDKLFDAPEKADMAGDALGIDVGDLGVDEAVAATLPTSVARAEEPVKLPDISGFSLEELDDVEAAPPAPAAKSAEPSPVPPSMSKLAAAADWSLEDMLERRGPPAP